MAALKILVATVSVISSLLLLILFRDPMKVASLNFGNWVLNTLTPKFYVALTGTSSLISGIILIFEWWYFKKHGTSFIEHVSVSHISPLFGAGDNDETSVSNPQVTECKVWRNPMNLFRGAEYQRYYLAMKRNALTSHDMNLTAQDYQTFFSNEVDGGRPEYDLMQQAWKEEQSSRRLALARGALEVNSEYVPAMILLAEEEATTMVEVEAALKQAYKIAEGLFRKSQKMLQSNAVTPVQEATHRRDAHVLVYVKRRLAMCARKLGKVREAVKLLRELMKDFPVSNLFNIHENLIEALLELQAYADVQAVLTKFDDVGLPKSASICYTAALLRARVVADKFSPDAASKRGLSAAEMSAVEAIHRAVEFNPHVPEYLLETRPLVLPAEHVLKRGDSEAIAYAFFHLPHWKRVDGALNLLHCTWEGTFRMLPYPLEKGHVFHPYPVCLESIDREILPPFHKLSVYPKKELPFFILFTAALCSITAALAVFTHHCPDAMAHVARLVLNGIGEPVLFALQKLDTVLPSGFLHHFSQV